MTATDNGQPAIAAQAPDPEVAAKAKRRRFSAAYKQRILDRYDKLDRGQKGALLRREGLYSSLITEWHRQLEAAIAESLERKPGRPKADPRDHRIRALERELDKTKSDLAKASRVIEVQGKVSALWEELNPGSAEAIKEHGQ